jgi:hypothetical protein
MLSRLWVLSPVTSARGTCEFRSHRRHCTFRRPELFAVGELKLAAAGVHGGADAAMFAQHLRDFRSILLHVTAADEARQHEDTNSAIAANTTREFAYDLVQQVR